MSLISNIFSLGSCKSTDQFLAADHEIPHALNFDDALLSKYIKGCSLFSDKIAFERVIKNDEGYNDQNQVPLVSSGNTVDLCTV